LVCRNAVRTGGGFARSKLDEDLTGSILLPARQTVTDASR
jgi:hypothetical protein